MISSVGVCFSQWSVQCNYSDRRVGMYRSNEWYLSSYICLLLLEYYNQYIFIIMHVANLFFCFLAMLSQFNVLMMLLHCCQATRCLVLTTVPYLENVVWGPREVFPSLFKHATIFTRQQWIFRWPCPRLGVIHSDLILNSVKVRFS